MIGHLTSFFSVVAVVVEFRLSILLLLSLLCGAFCLKVSVAVGARAVVKGEAGRMLGPAIRMVVGYGAWLSERVEDVPRGDGRILACYVRDPTCIVPVSLSFTRVPM